jgi:hypothetical protein
MKSRRVLEAGIAVILLLAPRAHAEPPIWEDDIGSPLGLTDDSTYEATLDFDFTYEGLSFVPGNSMFISSNGFLTLGRSSGPGCCSPTGADLASSTYPCIAPGWTDLIPDIRVSGDVYLHRFPNRVVITWATEVYATGFPVRFQVQLSADGTIVFGYDGCNFSGNTRNVLVGIGPAVPPATDPGSTDLSASIPFTLTPAGSPQSMSIYELFAAPNPAFDLDQTNIVFTPIASVPFRGFRVTRESCRPPVWEPSYGQPLFLTDDSTFEASFGSFAFPFDGAVYSGSSILSISSNGFVSIGGSNGSACCNGNPADLVEAPFGRIAAMWTDLVPSADGDVFVKELDFANGAFHRMVVTWDTAFYDGSRPVTAQLQLHDDGSFSLGWNCWYGTTISNDVLIGTSSGGGVPDPGSTDFSAAVPFSTDYNPTVYEQFRSAFPGGPPFDLAGRNLFFRPNGFGGWVVSTNCPDPPIWEPNFGTPLNLGDDSTFDSTFGLMRFPFPFAGRYYTGRTPISISSNGFVSLGGSNGPGCCNGDPADFLSGAARIAAAWTDLYPQGETYLNTFNSPDGLSVERFVVTWDSLFYSSRGQATAQLQLLANGTIVTSYRCFDRLDGASDVLVGLTTGGGATDPGSIDLTASLPFDSGTQSTMYELFPYGSSSLDLAGKSFVFEPNGRGGYHVDAIGSAAGTVNSGAGVTRTRDVLRVNGSVGGPITRRVTVAEGAPITLALDAAPAGPSSNAGYALWIWAGENAHPTELRSNGRRLGCLVNPMPLQPARTPQPVLCLHSNGLAASVCGALPRLPAPSGAPWTLTRPGGFGHATRFTIQGILRDDGAANASHFSTTNAVVVDVP